MQLLTRAFTYIFLILSFAVCAFADDESLPIKGRVVDANGDAVVQAKVTADDVDRRFKTSTVTNSSGEFQFSLPAGTYLITVRANGFSEVRQPLSVASGGRNG